MPAIRDPRQMRAVARMGLGILQKIMRFLQLIFFKLTTEVDLSIAGEDLSITVIDPLNVLDFPPFIIIFFSSRVDLYHLLSTPGFTSRDK